MKPMSLGQLIKQLELVEDKANTIYFDFGHFQPIGFHSYRGYYSDLAIGYNDVDEFDLGITVAKFLNECNEAVGQVFTGWKGGNFRMDRGTPVWVALYGAVPGIGIIRVLDLGYKVVLETRLIDY